MELIRPGFLCHTSYLFVRRRVLTVNGWGLGREWTELNGF